MNVKNIVCLIAVLVLGSASAAAQQATPSVDVEFMQRSIAALQQQRNEANDLAAWLRAQTDVLTDRLAKSEAHVRELVAKQGNSPGPVEEAK